MNLKHLNLDLYNIPKDDETQITIFLIASDLKTRKLINGLTSIGCDNCFCVSDLCDLILAMIGFKVRPNQLYDFYFDVLDRYCDKVTQDNDLPINEAFSVYKILKIERQRHQN